MLFGFLKADRGWMVSAVARRRLLACSVTFLAGCAVYLFAISVPGWEQAVTDSTVLRVTVRTLDAVTMFGAIAVVLGMLWYCANLDRRKWYSKLFLSVSFLLLPPFSAIVYHFLVYRPQTRP